MSLVVNLNVPAGNGAGTAADTSAISLMSAARRKSNNERRIAARNQEG